MHLFLIFILIILTTAIYYQSLNGDFLSTWDDNGYITENEELKSYFKENKSLPLAKIFRTYEMGNYHPLTMLSYYLEYKFFELNPRGYHTTNLLLHLMNIILVYGFIWLLVKQQLVAFITALFFAIHPMHVESVAWISERKDLLYALFYLASLYAYTRYKQCRKGKWSFYSVALLLFILSLFSKGMAVTLPLVLLAIDYYLDRKPDRSLFLEKIPFIVLSVIFSYIAIDAQRSVEAINSVVSINVFDRIVFSSYALTAYLWKLIAPFNLSCFYSYPEKQSGLFPLTYYSGLLVLLVIGYFVYKSRKTGKNALFGVAFYFITIALVAQIIPVGSTIIADRYTYIPYIGIFFIFAQWASGIMKNGPSRASRIRVPLFIFLFFLVTMFSYITIERIKVWNNDIELWTDAIEKNENEPTSYKNRGVAYSNAGEFKKAIADYNRAVELRIDFPGAHYNRGLAYCNLGDFNRGIVDFTVAIQLDPASSFAHNNRGNAYFVLEKYQLAIEDYTNAIRYNEFNTQAYFNRGLVNEKLGRRTEALQDIMRAQELGLKINPKVLNRLQ